MSKAYCRQWNSLQTNATRTARDVEVYARTIGMTKFPIKNALTKVDKLKANRTRANENLAYHVSNCPTCQANAQ